MTFLTGEDFGRPRFLEAEEAYEIEERQRRSDAIDDAISFGDFTYAEEVDIDESFKLESMLKGFWIANRIIQKEWETLTRWERAQVERDMRAELDCIEAYGNPC